MKLLTLLVQLNAWIDANPEAAYLYGLIIALSFVYIRILVTMLQQD